MHRLLYMSIFFVLLGLSACSMELSSICDQKTLSQTELCNGVDDNCNGKVDEGCVLTLVGNSGKSGYKDGDTKNALLHSPYAIAFDKNEHLYIADSGNKVIRKLSLNGKISTVAGIPGKTGYRDGSAQNSLFSSLSDLAFNQKGVLYIADADNELIRKFSENGDISIVAGIPGKSGHKDGPAKSALFATPVGTAFDSKGNSYITDTLNHVIRKLSESGKVLTVAGVPGKAGYRDGPATTALFSTPVDTAFDKKGNLYIVDHFNHVIRKRDTNGQVTTIAGIPEKTGYRDGPATTALFHYPVGIAVDDKGNLYIADKENHVIRKLDVNGEVSTFAGIPGKPGHKNGIKNKAAFRFPKRILFHKTDLYVVDTGNHAIKKIILP